MAGKRTWWSETKFVDEIEHPKVNLQYEDAESIPQKQPALELLGEQLRCETFAAEFAGEDDLPVYRFGSLFQLTKYKIHFINNIRTKKTVHQKSFWYKFPQGFDKLPSNSDL